MRAVATGFLARLPSKLLLLLLLLLLRLPPRRWLPPRA
jgi:hypothetical protein